LVSAIKTPYNRKNTPAIELITGEVTNPTTTTKKDIMTENLEEKNLVEILQDHGCPAEIARVAVRVVEREVENPYQYSPATRTEAEVAAVDMAAGYLESAYEGDNL